MPALATSCGPKASHTRRIRKNCHLDPVEMKGPDMQVEGGMVVIEPALSESYGSHDPFLLGLEKTLPVGDVK
jgi:hypothetical protein